MNKLISTSYHKYCEKSGILFSCINEAEKYLKLKNSPAFHDMTHHLQFESGCLKDFLLLMDRSATFWQICGWREELGPLCDWVVSHDSSKSVHIESIIADKPYSWQRLSSHSSRLNYAHQHLIQYGPMHISYPADPSTFETYHSNYLDRAA